MRKRRPLAELDDVVAEMVPAFEKYARRVMVAEWGDRCDEYEPGCPCCDAWRFFDRYGVAPTVKQLHTFQIDQ